MFWLSQGALLINSASRAGILHCGIFLLKYVPGCRFADNPLVAKNVHPIRFYAGAPLIASNGHRIGAM